MNIRNKVRPGKKPSARQAAKEILLLGTTAVVSPENKERLSLLLSGKVDWKHLVNLAVFHDVAPLLYRSFIDNGLNNLIPAPNLERLENLYNQTLYKNVILSDELARVLAAFRQRDITVVSLKGTVLAEMLYENPALRMTSDLDILVHPGELTRARALLNELGYRQTGYQAQHPFHGSPYCRQAAIPIYIELHWDLDDARLMPTRMDEIWRRVRKLPLECCETLFLSREDTVLLAIDQLCKTFDSLKLLSDIAALIKKYRDELDWDYIIGSARSWGIVTGAYYSLKLAAVLLQAPVPSRVLVAVRPAGWRRIAIEFLTGPEAFISSIRWKRLRTETQVLFRGLTMNNMRQTSMVLKKYRGPRGKGFMLRTAFWIAVVLVATLRRNMARKLSFV